MNSNDYWKVEYELDDEKNVIYLMGSYKNYDKQKIKAIYNELNPDWKKLKITKVKDLKFKKPDGGSDVETRS
tara:strand:- start:1327 stop:1542 length:216 start_codon:yes stop_codon:yes gene_type:complete